MILILSLTWSLILMEGYNAVHKAAMNGHTQVVRHLCEMKVVVDCQDFYGRTPLMEASSALHA